MKLRKCHFFTKEIQYLGHILSTKGIRPLPFKTQAINNMHPPKMAKQVHTFLGLIRYYRKFIRNLSKLPSHWHLTHQTAKFGWTPTHHTTFLTLRNQLYKHLSYTIWIQQSDTWYTQTQQTMHVKHNSHKNMMTLNSQ